MRRLRLVAAPESTSWLDPADPAHRAYAEALVEEQGRIRPLDGYYEMAPGEARACERAAEELHRMCLAATEEVLRRDEWLGRFGLPRAIWPRMRASFAAREPALTGRFDCGFVDGRLKLFEYNADNASMLLENAELLDRWAHAAGVAEGSIAAGERLERLLVRAWQERKLTGRVHFLIDDETEERYNALFMMRCAARAGIETKLVVGMDGLRRTGGAIVDDEGAPLRVIWKTWLWETAFADAVRRRAGLTLSDILPGDEPRTILEPIWKAVPSNKGILPVLWEMFPNHPNLLRAEWEPCTDLRRTGYVRKPVVGRCGRNIEVRDGHGVLIAETPGDFGDRRSIYQEYFPQPERDGFRCELGLWMVGDRCGGLSLREDTGAITGWASPVPALRIRENA